MTSDEVSRRLDEARPISRRFTIPRLPHINLAVRLCILVLIAIFPAIVIQGYNEYELRKAREADIRQQVIQVTKQFGEEIGELREGARQLLLALSQLPAVRLQDTDSCSEHFAALKSQYANYSLLAAADTEGHIFCSSSPTTNSSVADQPFFTRAMAQDGLAVGNYWADPATGQRMIHFAVRFGDGDGRAAGVVFAGLDLGWLSDHLKERGIGADILDPDCRSRGQHHCSAAKSRGPRREKHEEKSRGDHGRQHCGMGRGRRCRWHYAHFRIRAAGTAATGFLPQRRAIESRSVCGDRRRNQAWSCPYSRRSARGVFGGDFRRPQVPSGTDRGVARSRRGVA